MTNRRISPLSIRILLIMLLPLILFFIGILALDRYRIVLIDAELNALKRQGETLARSLALANADSTNKINSLDFSERGLAKAALRHILPLVGWFVGCFLVGWLAGWLVGCLLGPSVCGWLATEVGWTVSRTFGRLVRWLLLWRL